jgi:ABC-type antimicrobial peptide transport system permease subunit
VLGIAATFPISAALATSLFGVSRIDLPVFAGVVAALFVTGGLATVGPGIRAARVDPLRAFRQE